MTDVAATAVAANQEGRQARGYGHARNVNPFPADRDDHKWFDRGWAAEDGARKRQVARVRRNAVPGFLDQLGRGR